MSSDKKKKKQPVQKKTKEEKETKAAEPQEKEEVKAAGPQEKKGKKEKKDKKEKKQKKQKEPRAPVSPETGQAVLRSVTALVCTAAVCISASSVTGKISDAAVKSAEARYGSGTSVSEGDGTVSADTATDGSLPSDSSVPVQDGSTTAAGDVSAPDAAEEAGTSSSSAASSAGKAGTGTAQNTNDPTKYSVAQIVNYYNTSLKNTYSLPKLTIEKTEEIKIVIDEVHPGGEAFTKLGNKIIERYATKNTTTATFENGKSTDGGDDAQEFSFHANLDPAGAQSASVKKVANGYEINITVKPEKATLENRPVYNSQCANPLDLGSVDLFGLKITQADFNYPGTTLKAVVDPQGRVISAASNMSMNGTGAGKLGITGSATVHGGLVKSAKFIF